MADPTHRTHIPGNAHAAFSGNVPVRGKIILGQTQATTVKKQAVQQIAQGIWRDFKSTNQSLAGKGARIGGGMLIAANVAKYYETLTPLMWAAKGFGPLPYEFVGNGTLMWTELSVGARLARVAIPYTAAVALTLIAFEGGVLIGSTINQFLPDNVKDDIGGTINEVINEGGYKELWKHPFGIGM